MAVAIALMGLALVGQQPPGEPLLDEVFADNRRGWAHGSDEAGTVALKGGAISLEVAEGRGKFSTVPSGLTEDDDFRIEVTIGKKHGADNRGYGMIFGSKGAYEHYRFVISGDGHYLYSITAPTGERILINWTKSPQVRQGNSSNVLAVEKRGSNLHFEINGVEVAKGRLSELFGPNAGVYSGTAGRVEATRVRIWKLRSGAGARSAASPGAVPRVVAVLDFEDAGGATRSALLAQLPDYLATLLTQKGYATIPREKLRRSLETMKKESNTACLELACRVRLGRTLAAEGIVTTKVQKVADECVVTTNLFDLRSETILKAASVETRCEDKPLMASMKQLAEQL